MHMYHYIETHSSFDAVEKGMLARFFSVLMMTKKIIATTYYKLKKAIRAYISIQHYCSSYVYYILIFSLFSASNLSCNHHHMHLNDIRDMKEITWVIRCHICHPITRAIPGHHSVLMVFWNPREYAYRMQVMLVLCAHARIMYNVFLSKLSFRHQICTLPFRQKKYWTTYHFCLCL